MENTLQKIGTFLGKKFTIIDQLFAKKTDLAKEEQRAISAEETLKQKKVDKQPGKELMPSPSPDPDPKKFLGEDGTWKTIDLQPIQQNIENIRENYQAADQQLQQKITEETTRAQNAENTKVDKIQGKQLMPSPSSPADPGKFLSEDGTWKTIDLGPVRESINKIETAYKAADQELDTKITAETTRAQNAEQALSEGKVDKIEGKGLSENDYTSIEKNKLQHITTYIKQISLPQGGPVLNISYNNPGTATEQTTSLTLKEANSSAQGLMSSKHYNTLENLQNDGNYLDKTGTPSPTWQLSKNTGPLLKNSGGILELRNHADTQYTDLTLKNITIKGDVTQEGASFIVNAQTVQTADNTILLNKGEVGAGITKGSGGIEIDRGTLPSYKILFDESDDRFKVGTENNLQPILLRDDETHLNNGNILIWDAESKKAKTGKNLDNELTKYALKKDIPETLKNPHPLLFEGATNTTYDGSAAVQVNIPVISDLTTIAGDTNLNGLIITGTSGPNIIKARPIRETDIPSTIARTNQIPEIPSLSGGSPATSGQYINAITVNGHTITATKAALPTSLPASDVHTWAKQPGKPSYNFNEITDAVTQNVNPGTVTRKIIMSKTKNNEGYHSSVALGLTNPSSEFSPAILSVATDAGANWIDYTFGTDGRISSPQGTFALTSEIPATLPANGGNADKLTVQDTRNSQLSPNTTNKQLMAWFSNKGTPTADWWSGIHINGWEADNYAAWQLCGPAQTAISNALYFRSGLNSSWNNWKRIAFADEIPDISQYATQSWVNETFINWSHIEFVTDGDSCQLTLYNGNNDASQYTIPGANDTHAGLVTTGAQTFGGDKTFLSTVTAQNGFYDTSDIRLKENIKPIKLKSGKIKLYEFDKNGKHSYGVIAQEIEQQYPGIVRQNEDGYKIVNYNEALTIKCAELENENKTLKNRLDKLQQLLTDKGLL